MASAWGASWAAFWGNAWGDVGAVTPTVPPLAYAGAGTGTQPSRATRKRLREEAKRLVEAAIRADADESAAMEAVWNRIHGIAADEPVPEPIIEAVAEVRRVPKRSYAERDDLMDRLAGLIAEFRSDVSRQIEAQRLADEQAEEDAIIALLMAV